MGEAKIASNDREPLVWPRNRQRAQTDTDQRLSSDQTNWHCTDWLSARVIGLTSGWSQSTFWHLLISCRHTLLPYRSLCTYRNVRSVFIIEFARAQRSTC